jgi:hypothetical protein
VRAAGCLPCDVELRGNASINLAAGGPGRRRGLVCIVSQCIHNWDEVSCVRILAHRRQAMLPHGRLLIVETVVGDGDAPDPAKLLVRAGG